MTLLREAGDDFRGAIDQTSKSLGLAPLFVEKDYWVTQVLRALHQRYPGSFVFKGGTSLSKGYGLIDRFSEDVDVLVTPSSGDSAAKREKLLKDMTENVAATLDVRWDPARDPGRGKFPHRADIIAYPRTVTGSVSVPVEDRGVLLETGYAGGEWPAEMVTVTPLLTTALGLNEGEYADTDGFRLRALNPARTLLEKLALLHHIASGWAPDGPLADQRCGRHYYDVWCLLDYAPTRTVLADRKQFEQILGDMQHISATHYGGWTDRPEDGFAASPAFFAATGTDLRTWLEGRYRDASELMPSRTKGNWPTFGKVLRRIEHRATLL